MSERDNVIPIQQPPPLPTDIPFSTPSPEDTLIEILDDEKNIWRPE